MKSAKVSDYTPQVGDVVEYQWQEHACKGIVFKHEVDSVPSSIGREDKEKHGGSQFKYVSNIRKIGHTDLMGSTSSHSEADDIAKAYFAKEPECTYGTELDKPEYKVGDLVEVVDCSSSSYFNDGVAYRVGEASNQRSLKLKYKAGFAGYITDEDIRPLSGTYAERQAKWIEFHGLKKGDKVKVVRKFEQDEDGYAGYNFDNRHLGQVGEYAGEMGSGGLKLEGLQDMKFDSPWHPYFALEPVTD